jgi:hypothetical protein
MMITMSGLLLPLTETASWYFAGIPWIKLSQCG